jgi:ABC-2 type transport system permease protein
VLASPYLYLSPLSLLALLPVYAVWALPTVGWLMLVSGWARTKPLLWAVGVPLMALFIVKWISLTLGGFGEMEHDLMHTANGIVARILGGLIPGLWFAFDGQALPGGLYPNDQGIVLNNVVAESWKSLVSADAWVGAALGIAMLAGAARLRRWRDEG